MVKIILIKSPDEWATMKQTCRDELVVYLSFSSQNTYTALLLYWALFYESQNFTLCIYIYIYIYIKVAKLR